MNNRGKPLSHLELLKNRLIFLSTRLRVDEEDRKSLRSIVNEAWKTIYHYLGKSRARTLDDDHFLFVHFLLYFGDELNREEKKEAISPAWRVYRPRGGSDFFKNYLLEHVFTVKKPNETNGGSPDSSHISQDKIKAYALDIKQAVHCFYDMHNPEPGAFAPDQLTNLIRLGRLGWGDAQTLVMTVLAGGKLYSGRLSDLLRSLERYMFVSHFLTTPRRIGAMYVDLVQSALELRNGRTKIESIISDLDNVVAAK